MAKIEYIKLEISIPRVTYQLIKDKKYLPVDEDIICKAVRNGTECKSVLDRIKSEIEQLPITDTAVRLLGDIIDKYKAERSGEE